MKLAMAIDVSKCIGCKACAVACKSNNNLPNGIWWNRVDMNNGQDSEAATGTYPGDLSLGFVPTACQQCDKPACVEVCPVGATWKETDGIVVIDAEICNGCELCLAACPYNARSFNYEEPEYQTDFPLGDEDAPAHVALTAEKCDLCAHRRARDAEPACMELCLARCRVWGDLEDPQSEISEFIAGKQTFSLLEDRGTYPSTLYIR
ncbi:MAG: 4Fe-4S dicluster domain-containing protein [Coriobacteriales bacterium]|jgi:molybdopterin-containing oxidoreductase family iron-sulfur binding subunit|nr:4Fe-4S dicluster domain-containing protein [Coriobacteriales bacterium]